MIWEYLGDWRRMMVNDLMLRKFIIDEKDLGEFEVRWVLGN